ncbi:Lrp/AsnC family transcriptional regulator [Saccharopolyspora shandongensis]|nr:Lrp/AsnC family transcriptional regulator [Saccharopolyspora shandongensis]
MRALREAGVIARFHAQLDLAAPGLPIQALIKVRLGSHQA